VRAAALAPAEPSPQDRAVAAQAMQLMLQAQAELASETSEGDESRGGVDESGPSTRVRQDASDTYQSVSGFDAASETARAFQPFQASA
jgi:hypothetical protein